ncbi:MAG: hypothetical protein KJ941_06255 [Bacteroidetes bacterium]|nr:hypothetical protein [Bacteroidota bacterium]
MKGVTLIFALIQMNCWGQKDSIIDHRDNEKYAVVNIGNSIWFLDYLRYKSENAFFNTDTDKLERIEVNYYPNSELKTACPTGWHVATIDEWEAYIDTLQFRYSIDDMQIKYDTLPAPNNSIIVSIDSLSIFSDTTLNLKPVGWVEGKEITNKETLTIWITYPNSEDSKYHIHISDNEYIKHTHKHNIIDKRKKTRQFAIRCVAD